jgi:hypothetical protein
MQAAEHILLLVGHVTGDHRYVRLRWVSSQLESGHPQRQSALAKDSVELISEIGLMQAAEHILLFVRQVCWIDWFTHAISSTHEMLMADATGLREPASIIDWLTRKHAHARRVLVAAEYEPSVAVRDSDDNYLNCCCLIVTLCRYGRVRIELEDSVVSVSDTERPSGYQPHLRESALNFLGKPLHSRPVIGS